VKLWREIGGRAVAYIILKISVTGGGLALLGVDTLLSLLAAAWVGILEFAEELSKAYLEDGKITRDELNSTGQKLIEKTEKKK
jgi:hypothetical protein